MQYSSNFVHIYPKLHLSPPGKVSSSGRCTPSSIKIMDKQHTQAQITKLYPKYKTYLEPNSVTYIPLRCRQKIEVKIDKSKDPLVKGNKNFEKRKLLQIDNMTICTWRNPTIAVYNTQDTGISLSKSDVVASAESWMMICSTMRIYNY